MPALKDERHELYAQGLAAGKKDRQAYKDAGFAGHRSSASRLRTNANIVARVAELQEAGRQKALVTLESLTEMYREAYAVGERTDNAAGMNGAVNGLMKLHGLEVDPRKNNRGPLEEVADDVLADTIDRLAAEAGFDHGLGGNGKATTH